MNVEILDWNFEGWKNIFANWLLSWFSHSSTAVVVTSIDGCGCHIYRWLWLSHLSMVVVVTLIDGWGCHIYRLLVYQYIGCQKFQIMNLSTIVFVFAIYSVTFKFSIWKLMSSTPRHKLNQIACFFFFFWIFDSLGGVLKLFYYTGLKNLKEKLLGNIKVWL